MCAKALFAVCTRGSDTEWPISKRSSVSETYLDGLLLFTRASCGFMSPELLMRISVSYLSLVTNLQQQVVNLLANIQNLKR